MFPIETERCFIRHASLQDIDIVKRAMEDRDEDLRRWMSWSSDEGMSRAGVESYISNGLDANNRTDIPLFAFDKETGAFVLATGIHGNDDKFLETPTGWWVSKDFEGKGYAFEVMGTLIEFSFRMIGVQKITTEYYADNLRSKNLMERLGFKYVRTENNTHRCHLNGEMMDEHKYELVV